MFCSKCGALGFSSRGDESDSHLQQNKYVQKFSKLLIKLREITHHWMSGAMHVDN